MKEFIISEVHRVFSGAINRFAKELKAHPYEVQIRLYLANGGEVAYELWHKMQPVRPLLIKDILNYKLIDFKGYSAILPPFIQKALQRFEQDLLSNEVDVLVYLHRTEDEDADDTIDLFLYNGPKFVRALSVDEFVPNDIAVPEQ